MVGVAVYDCRNIGSATQSRNSSGSRPGAHIIEGSRTMAGCQDCRSPPTSSFPRHVWTTPPPPIRDTRPRRARHRRARGQICSLYLKEGVVRRLLSRVSQWDHVQPRSAKERSSRSLTSASTAHSTNQSVGCQGGHCMSMVPAVHDDTADWFSA